MHNHANSFHSGVVYHPLPTRTHDGVREITRRNRLRLQERSCRVITSPITPINGSAQRPNRRCRAVSQLSHARGAAKPGRTPHHPGFQRDSYPLGFLGLPNHLQRLSMEHGSVSASGVETTLVSRPGEARRRLALGLMVASGFAALGYQIVWTQQSTLWLATKRRRCSPWWRFLRRPGGRRLALGPRIDRSAKPAVGTRPCEAVIGLWSLMLAFLMAPVTG